MPIEMPRGLPFSVDTWTPASRRKRYHFLTHAHRDHLAGISSHASYPIYSTSFTTALVLRSFPQLEESLFVEIEVGKPVVIDDPDGSFSVSAFDANHCPGAIMFLFEGEFGNILHTGDCRLTPDCLQYLPLKYISKKGKTVINCIWKHPNAPVVYLACDLLGQEEILVEVSRTFGSKIYVDRTNSSECYQALLVAAPEVLSQDNSCHFQVVEGFPRLGERAKEKLDEARARHQPEPLFIRPSAQWYAGNDHLEMTQRQKPRLTEAERDESGVWHVCYSIHSSREELEWALQLLQPKWVISTTPPCRAMELDYVKNHCFKTCITPDDPLWKLLKVGPGKSTYLPPPIAPVALQNDSASTSVVAAPTSAVCNRLQLKNLATDHFELKLDLPPPSKARPITLFGRARLGLQDPDVLQEGKSEISISRDPAQVLSIREGVIVEQASSLQDCNIVVTVQELAEQSSSLSGDNNARPSIEKPVDKADVEKTMQWIGTSNGIDVNEPRVEKLEEAGSKSDISCIGSSRRLSDSLKKLYRSMNAPVPRPLPSLVELMDASKRIKICSESRYRPNYCYHQSICLHKREI